MTALDFIVLVHDHSASILRIKLSFSYLLGNLDACNKRLNLLKTL